jgi:outer membrane autotransporter protein
MAALFGGGGGAVGAASTLNGVAMGSSASSEPSALGSAARDTGVAAGRARGAGGDTGMAASGDSFGVNRANWGANASGQNGLWGQALGGGGRIASDGNGAGSSYRAGGFVAGYDRALSDQWLIGVAGGYNRASWDANTNGVAPASGKVQTPQGAVYARYASGPWMVSLAGTYADHKFDTNRTVTIGTTSSIASSSHRAGEWGFGAQAEYALAAGSWQVRPLAGLRYSHLREDSFAESGAGAASLSVDARTTQSTTLSAGVRLLRAFSASLADGGFELRAVASHLYGDNDSPISARLAGQAASFTSTGTPLKRDALTVGAGVSARLGRNFSGYVDASYEARGSGQNAYAIGAGMKLVW